MRGTHSVTSEHYIGLEIDIQQKMGGPTAKAQMLIDHYTLYKLIMPVTYMVYLNTIILEHISRIFNSG